MPLTHIEKFKVRYTECDQYGHVNNANYLLYMQEAAFGASAEAGYDLAKYDELGQYWLVRETDIEYLTPLRYQDEFEINVGTRFRRYLQDAPTIKRHSAQRAFRHIAIRPFRAMQVVPKQHARTQL